MADSSESYCTDLTNIVLFAETAMNLELISFEFTLNDPYIKSYKFITGHLFDILTMFYT